jgi:hypothetical protein
MAKIDYFIPEPTDEFSPDNQRQILQALATLRQQLNTSYLEEQLQAQERFTWYNVRYGC